MSEDKLVHHGSDKRPVSPSSINPASPTFERLSWADYYHQQPPADALEKAIASTELSRTVAKLVAADVLEAGALTPCSIVSEMRRVLGEARVEAWSLLRRHPRLSVAEPAVPLRWIETALERHPAPSEVFERAFPAESHRLFSLRVPVLGWISHSIAHRRGGIPHLDGLILQRHWQRVPDAGRRAYPSCADANIKALAQISPDGELQLHRPGGGSYTIDLCHALMLEGQLSKWLREQTPKANGKTKNGASK